MDIGGFSRDIYGAILVYFDDMFVFLSILVVMWSFKISSRRSCI